MLRVAAVSATFLGAVSAQDAPRGPPGKIEGYTSYSQRACAWSQYEEGSDWKFGATTSDDSAACAALCEAADGCTGFEVGPATSSNYATSGGYCALWFNKACSAESDMLTLSQSAYLATTYVRDAPAAATTTAAAETPGMGNDAPTTTAVVATTAGEGLYVLKYPQQACEWAYYTEGEDWAMYLDGSNDPSTCAAGCLATEGCTGFEVGSNAGGVYAAGPYCALWFNGACAVPDESFSGAFGAFIGGSVDVDTYTLTEPVDAFKDFENRACAWSYYQEGADWAFADKTSEDPEACAKLCLDSPDGCTGFEVGVSSASTEFGDLSQGYCALWFNNSCAPDEFLEQYTGASTYVLIDGSGCDHSSSHMYYFMLMATGLMLCLLGCCCCRRAVIRRRLAMRRAAAAAANAAVAVRAPAGTAAVATVAVEGSAHRGTRAVVYAVQVGAEQEEPEKV